MARLKTSLGIWAFGPTATRFMPGGYHTEAVDEVTVSKVTRAVEGIGDLIDGYEFHYPNELDEDNAAAIKEALGKHDIYALGLGTFSMPEFGQGSFINPDEGLRKKAKDICRRGIDLAGELGAKFIIWPGGEGYNYPFQVNYDLVWERFIAGIAEMVDRANQKGVVMLLEHKCSEPAMKILMRDLGMTMYLIRKVADAGVDVSHTKINIDWQHLIMNGEPLAEYAALLARENLLGHQHGNSGWGQFDDDDMVGASFFMQTLGLARELQRIGYGKNGERVGFDLFPYTEDGWKPLSRASCSGSSSGARPKKSTTMSLPLPLPATMRSAPTRRSIKPWDWTSPSKSRSTRNTAGHRCPHRTYFL